MARAGTPRGRSGSISKLTVTVTVGVVAIGGAVSQLPAQPRPAAAVSVATVAAPAPVPALVVPVALPPQPVAAAVPAPVVVPTVPAVALAVASPAASAVLAPAAAAPTTPVVKTLSCAGDKHITLPDTSQLFNNTWNSNTAAGVAWRQCLLSRTHASGQVDWGWNWSWPTAGTAVYAYPEIMVGIKPWETGPGNDPRFPLQIASANTLKLSYDVDLTVSGSYNLAASIWLIRTPTVAAPPVHADIKTEVMVWTDYSPDMVADPGSTTLRGEFTDASGLTWAIWADERWGDASGGTGHQWTYIAFHIKPGQRRRAANIDVLALLKKAAALGLISNAYYVANVELGTEVVKGEGQAWLRRWNVEAN
jgi:Glycosyl hydrolase family 12